MVDGRQYPSWDCRYPNLRHPNHSRHSKSVRRERLPPDRDTPFCTVGVHFMYCLEHPIGTTHLQKVDSAFQALSAGGPAHPGRC